MKTLFVLAAMVVMATAFPGYQKNIPNGGSVPNPCSSGSTWPGVGHKIVQGTGELNPFGEAFVAAGHQWTYTLCQADSDRDGKSNGAELGDPHCHWTSRNHAHITPATSHPGVCEPIGSDQCKWQQFTCA